MSDSADDYSSSEYDEVFDEGDAFLTAAIDYLENLSTPKDDAQIYAEGWACSFRKLNSEQQLFAKKAIEEVLYLGQLNQLTLNTISTSENL